MFVISTNGYCVYEILFFLIIFIVCILIASARSFVMLWVIFPLSFIPKIKFNLQGRYSKELIIV